MLKFLKSIFLFLAAIVILFEEWLWDPLKEWMRKLNRWPLVRRLAAAIARLSPHAAVAVFLAPMLLLLPFKIAGLWLIAHRHALLGLATFLSAKIVGTALFAWLFNLTQPALLQISWFARVYQTIQRISASAHAWIRRQSVFRRVRIIAFRVRRRLKQFMRQAPGHQR